MSYRPDPAFDKRAIYDSDIWDEIFDEKGKQIEGAAKAFAAPHVKTGDFLEHIHGEFHRASDNHPFYRVENDDDAAFSIEFGTAHTKAQRVLRRAIEEAEEE